VCGPSHHAIGNLLDANMEHAMRNAPGLVVENTGENSRVDEALEDGSVDVVAGTAWLFAREELAGTLDVLLVDEAGQVSLANTIALSGAARNLVFVGDPQPLSQPLKGTHPEGRGAISPRAHSGR
jgi:hypothetical protein